MYRILSIHLDGEDHVVASVDVEGHVSIQLHPHDGGGATTLIFGAAVSVTEGLAAIDRFEAALHQCKVELERRLVVATTPGSE